MKKITAIILAMMLAAALIVPMSAAGTALFYLDAESTVAAGDTIEVTLNIDSNPGIAGTSIAILYDADAFYVADPDEDVFDTGRTGSRLTLVASAVNSDTFENKTNVGFVFGQASNTTRNGGLATVVFTAKDDAVTGDYTFDIEVLNLGNANKENVPYDIDDPISVHVDGADPIPPIPDDTVTVGFSASTEDADKVSANFYVTVPATADVTSYKYSVDGSAAVALGANAKFSVPKAAKEMGDDIVFTIYDKDNKDVATGTTSIKAYCNAIASSDAYTDDIKAVASSMLVYGAAAQRYFNYNTDALVTNAKEGNPVNAGRFDTYALQHALFLAGAPVEYTSMNAQFQSQTTLLVAFKVTTGEASDALDWVTSNVAFAADGVSASIMTSGSNKFVVVKIAGIAVDEINSAIDISVAGSDAGSISVANYLAAVENTASASANMKDLARALYAYATAVDALA